MNRKAIAQQLTESVVSVHVFLGAEPLSRGSGFLFNDDGHVFTAAHVINNGRPFKSGELKGEELKIWVKIKGLPPTEYFQAIPSLSIDCTGLKDRLHIDLAGLAPKVPLAQPTRYLATCIRRPVIGEDVMLAGFSDEVYLPFGLQHRLISSLKGFQEFVAAREMGYDVELGTLMIKSGMVGSSFGYEFGGKDVEVKGSIFFVDNMMHPGASGGPVVDENGEVIGVITERAITRLGEGAMPDLRVPSGSTHAMNLEPLTAIRMPNRDTAVASKSNG